MIYCDKPNTVVRRTAPVLTSATSEVLELNHTLCDCNEICADTTRLGAHIGIRVLGSEVIGSTGVYAVKLQAFGKLIYQPTDGCNSCGAEDPIFAEFEAYTTQPNALLNVHGSLVSPITTQECQRFTNRVRIAVPFQIVPMPATIAASEPVVEPVVPKTK